MKTPVHMYTTGATSLPKHMASSPVSSGVRIAQSLVDLRSHVEVSMHVQDYLRISSIRCSHDNISMLSPVNSSFKSHRECFFAHDENEVTCSYMWHT